MLVKHHFDRIQFHQVLTSLTKEELDIFSCLESLKRQRKRKLQGVLFRKVVSLEPKKV